MTATTHEGEFTARAKSIIADCESDAQKIAESGNKYAYMSGYLKTALLHLAEDADSKQPRSYRT